MDLNPIFIRYNYHGQWKNAKIRPCCRENNIVDYAVWVQGKLEFTITKNNDAPEGSQWVVALKNADNLLDNELVQIIGAEIDLKDSELQGKHS